MGGGAGTNPSCMCEWSLFVTSALQCGGGHGADGKAAASEGIPTSPVHHHPSEQDIVSLHSRRNCQEGSEYGKEGLLGARLDCTSLLCVCVCVCVCVGGRGQGSTSPQSGGL